MTEKVPATLSADAAILGIRNTREALRRGEVTQTFTHRGVEVILALPPLRDLTKALSLAALKGIQQSVLDLGKQLDDAKIPPEEKAELTERLERYLADTDSYRRDQRAAVFAEYVRQLRDPEISKEDADRVKVGWCFDIGVPLMMGPDVTPETPMEVNEKLIRLLIAESDELRRKLEEWFTDIHQFLAVKREVELGNSERPPNGKRAAKPSTAKPAKKKSSKSSGAATRSSAKKRIKKR